MTSLRSLPAFLRTIDPGDGADDVDLFRQFAATKSESAFAGLLRRHGRLVWTACRHLTDCEADADDAFQATFLVLFQKAKAVRDPARLSSWLYGVAAKVCGKLRQSRSRRTNRERRLASPEQSRAVPDSAWDRTLAAVYEEVVTLPETLRIPFVMCCLDGQGVTEAAARLGLKLGTFSGRLTRAKDAILERLAKRGLALGAVAGVGLTVPPPSSVAAVLSIPTGGTAIPSAILALTKGVTDMALTTKVKVLAAAVLVACGLTTTLGTGRLAEANAQPPGKTAAELKQPEAKADPSAVERLAVDLFLADVVREKTPNAATFSTPKWDYDLVICSDLGQSKFMDLLKGYEDRGWDYHGTTPIVHEGKKTTAWVFRRPTTKAEVTISRNARMNPTAPNGLSEAAMPLLGERVIVNRTKTAEVRSLERQLAWHKGQSLFFADELPLDTENFAKLIGSLLERKFKGIPVNVITRDDGLALEAPEDVRKWAEALVKKLKE